MNSNLDIYKVNKIFSYLPKNNPSTINVSIIWLLVLKCFSIFEFFYGWFLPLLVFSHSSSHISCIKLEDAAKDIQMSLQRRRHCLGEVLMEYFFRIYVQYARTIIMKKLENVIAFFESVIQNNVNVCVPQLGTCSFKRSA